jgi:hypothetical protein
MEAAGLEEPDVLRANLKVATAQLLDIGYRLGDEIKASLRSRATKPKAHQEGTGAINTLMLVHRQITRYVQLDQQWAAEASPDKRDDADPEDAEAVV